MRNRWKIMCVLWQDVSYLCFSRIFGISEGRPLVFPGTFTAYHSGREEVIHVAVFGATLPSDSGGFGGNVEQPACSTAPASAPLLRFGSQLRELALLYKQINTLSNTSCNNSRLLFLGNNKDIILWPSQYCISAIIAAT